MLGILALTAVNAACPIFLSYVLKLIIDTVNSYQSNLSTLLITLLPFVFLFIALESAYNLLWRLIDYLMLYSFPYINASIISYMFNYTITQSHHFFQEHFGGDLTSKIADMTQGIDRIMEKVRDIVRYCVAIIVAILMALTIHYIFSIIILVWSLFFIVISAYLSTITMQRSVEVARARNSVFGTVVDCFTNAMNVRLFARGSYENRRLQSYLDVLVHRSQQYDWQSIITRFWLGVLSVTIISIMLFTLLFLRSKEMVTVGDFAFIILLCDRVIESTWYLSEELSKISKYVGMCIRSFELLKEPHEIVDHADAKTLHVSAGEISFKNVTFSYIDNRPLFTDLSVTIAGGQRIGLVGSSGSGKSSFVHLIIRLFDIQQGTIAIDNQPIEMVTQKSLYYNIGFIPQDPILFHRSVFDNIQYGNIHASYDQIVAAAQSAHAHDFIMNMPEQYNTIVGERGIKLSGGQRQRIAIARAFLKNAPILILDEATSALDSLTESLIQDSLQQLMQDKTVIVIAHRLSTLLMLDRILVFEQGKIIEDGSHEQLLERNGLYARLWQSQARGFLVDEE